MAAALLMLMLAGCTAWKEKPVNSWSQATGGEHLERLLWQNVKARKWTELQQHMAATWVWLTPNGPLDRAASLARLQKLQLADYTLGEFQVRPEGPDMVVTYIATARGTLDGQPLPEQPQRMLTVWQQAKNGWVAVAHAQVR